MTISRRDVKTFSSGPAPDAPPVSVDEADRIAAVLGRNGVHRSGPAAGPQPSVSAGAGGTGSSRHEPGRAAEPVPKTELTEPGRPDEGPRSATRLPRGDVLRLMQRAGYSSTLIDEVGAQLPEEVDRDRDRSVLEKYGLTRGMLMERFGSSP